MAHVDKLFKEMEEVLDQLIENAEKLHEISKKVIDEDELSELQNHQKELLTSLVSLDEACHQADSGKSKRVDTSINKRIQEKLDHFEQLNSSFVNNVMNSHGLIQFPPRQSGKTKKHTV